jgi:methylmalonyl-CoA mutase N-terminal domain/subunit
MADDVRRTDSGTEISSVYTAEDLAGWDPDTQLGRPGQPPYTRGIYPSMHRGRLWTMRQYAGFGTAEATNERFRFLLKAGQTGLSCAFDLPTQMGYDSDHPRADGEVGRVGVAIDTIDDMRRLLNGLPLDKVTTSMTINSTAAILLLFYELVAEEQGVTPANIGGGTIQNDLLKEYIARGTYIYPPRQSMRLITDIFAYCQETIPRWNTISISGYHIREAGSTAVQEIAFTLANAIAYVQAAIDAGLGVDDFGPRLSFFWNAHNNFFEEIAKYRAARRMWYRIMTERFHAEKEASKLLRFHSQTGGSTLTAQQPENNVVRVASRRWPPCWAARRACTPTASTKRSGYRPSGPSPSPCVRSRSSATRAAWSTPPTPSAVRTSSRSSPTTSRSGLGSTSRRSTSWVARSRPSRSAIR